MTPNNLYDTASRVVKIMSCKHDMDVCTRSMHSSQQNKHCELNTARVSLHWQVYITVHKFTSSQKKKFLEFSTRPAVIYKNLDPTRPAGQPDTWTFLQQQQHNWLSAKYRLCIQWYDTSVCNSFDVTLTGWQTRLLLFTRIMTSAICIEQHLSTLLGSPARHGSSRNQKNSAPRLLSCPKSDIHGYFSL